MPLYLIYKMIVGEEEGLRFQFDQTEIKSKFTQLVCAYQNIFRYNIRIVSYCTYILHTNKF